MLDIRWNPSARELRQFAFIWLPAFFALVGGIVYWRLASVPIPATIWAVGSALVVLAWIVPVVRRPLYVAWMCAAYPIGWAVSHLILVLVFYGVMTPVGLLMRACGHDPLKRRFQPSADTYWVRRRPQQERKPSEYFRQY